MVLGIHYQTHYKFCMFCNVGFCTSCQDRHPRNHQEALKSSKDIETARDQIPDREDCINCGKTVHCRMLCDDCPVTTCFSCLEDMLDNWAAHEHKSVTFIRIPNEYALDYVEPSCMSCKLGSSFTHCARCSKGIQASQVVTECQTCLDLYQGTFVYCPDCASSGCSDHNPSHIFVTYVHNELSGVDEKYYKCRCLECFQGT